MFCHASGYKQHLDGLLFLSSGRLTRTQAIRIMLPNNYSTNCQNCHTTNPGWASGTFDHSTSSFPLTGAHATIATQCTACHANGLQQHVSRVLFLPSVSLPGRGRSEITSPTISPPTCQNCHNHESGLVTGDVRSQQFILPPDRGPRSGRLTV